MLELIAAAVLCLAPQGGAAAPTPPDPARVKEAVAALDKALASPKPEERCAAIEAAVGVVHADVIARVAKGLRDRDATVRAAAIGSLRFMAHPDALDALHELLRRDAEIAKDAVLAPELFHAIGQHASAKSIDLLADAPLGVLPMKADRCRILALGNIRSPKSVEALFRLMQTLGKERARPFMRDFRLALAALTGADHDESHEQWIAWWNANKKKIALPETRPELAPALELRWRAFWNSDATNRKALEEALGGGPPKEKGDKEKGKGGGTPPPGGAADGS